MNNQNTTPYELLLKRRSVRSYTSEQVPEELLHQVLEAGAYAPSGHGRQPFAFLAVEDKAIRDQLSELNASVLRQANPEYTGDPFYGAPAVITVLTDRRAFTGVLDGAAAIENMLLAACALGLGSCWINRAKQVFETKAGQEILKLAGFENPEELEGIGFVILGFSSEPLPKPAPRKARIKELL